jgi:hypothetical protein
MPRLNYLFYLTLLIIGIFSVYNLNYNTPFNDEAIYIVVGRMGLFAHDWWTYGASLWMAGLPYIYPALTALAYQTGGIIGSRFLNVIFGLLAAEETYRLTRQIRLFDSRTDQVAGIIAAGLVGLSTAGLYVARLATYDMPSFFFLLIAVNSFLKAEHFHHGKYYFLSALFLLIAFYTKIVAAIFYPPLLLLSLVIMRSRPKLHRSLYIKYLLLPLGLGLFLYFLFFTSRLLTFTQTHIDSGTGGTYWDIFRVIWATISPLLIISALTLPILVLAKKTRFTAVFLLLAAVIPVFHLILNRVPTLNKHLYLTVVFLAVPIGYAVSWFSRRYLRHPLVGIIIPVMLLVFALISLPELNRLEHGWLNTKAIEQYLTQRITPDHRILTENGSALVLALYDKVNPPTHMATFDWIDYSGFKGKEGYTRSVQDQYYDFIELDGQHEDNELYSLIHYQLTAKYSLVYDQKPFRIYAKIP